jgi:lipoyl(octanoyl) transferase
MVMEVLTPDTILPASGTQYLKRGDKRTVNWIIADEPVPYPCALEQMKAHASAIAAGTAGEAVWLVEHPPLYTSGTSAHAEDLLKPTQFPVFDAGRGGQYTYHGPGQRVAYVMLDLRERGRDIRALVQGLENWIIETLAHFNIKGELSVGRIGVWVKRPDKGFAREDKIAALGVRVSKWVSFHGISLNVSPDLSHYDGIVPCGITDQGVTSFEDLGHLVAMEEVDIALKAAFEANFGPVQVSGKEALVSTP